MIAEYKGANGQPPQIPPEVVANLHHRVMIGHAGPNRSTALCGDFHWKAKNNRWTLNYVLVHSRVKLKGGAELLVSTLYESMQITGHPMTIVPLKASGQEGRHNGKV
jgi:hypothetical protein